MLIWGGALLVPILGLVQAGGVSGLKTKIMANLQTMSATVAPDSYFHLWRDTGSFASNPMGVHWTGIVFGLGFVISFGYWTTDFLVVQRVLAAHNLRAARMAPIIGSFFKMAVPFIVILPGLLGLVLAESRWQPDAPGGPEPRHSGLGTAHLQPGAATDDGALHGARPARPWHHGSDCGIHERHGWQCERLLHRVDLRHLQATHSQDRLRQPLRAGRPGSQSLLA